MDESQFWSIVESSRKNLSPDNREGNFAQQLKDIKQLLSDLTDTDLIEFDKIFTTKLYDAYCWELWGAAYVILWWMFRRWVY